MRNLYCLQLLSKAELVLTQYEWHKRNTVKLSYKKKNLRIQKKTVNKKGKRLLWAYNKSCGQNCKAFLPWLTKPTKICWISRKLAKPLQSFPVGRFPSDWNTIWGSRKKRRGTHGVSSSGRNGDPSVAQVYTSVATMNTPSPANTALQTAKLPCAAMAGLLAHRETKRTQN
jgi:hypothetical protein